MQQLSPLDTSQGRGPRFLVGIRFVASMGEDVRGKSIAGGGGRSATAPGGRLFADAVAHLCVEHLAASAPGATIRCCATLVEQEGRRYLFELSAYDGDELIGRGKHERFAVKIDRFLAKLEARKQS